MATTTKTALIRPSDLQGDFITPPRCQGQIVTYSYVATEAAIIVRTHDASDNETLYTAYEWADDEPFEPWNDEPTLGEEIGPVMLAESWAKVSADDLAIFLGRLSEDGEDPTDYQGLMERVNHGPTFWRVECEDGGTFDTDTPMDRDAAVEAGERWLSEGEWPPLCEVKGNVYPLGLDRTDLDDSDTRITITTDPPVEPKCPEGDSHDWTSEGEGGCDENPGVWSTGGTTLVFRAHCRLCGLQRSEVSRGSQRNPGECDTVEYTMPDHWCAECQKEQCECDAEPTETQ